MMSALCRRESSAMTPQHPPSTTSSPMTRCREVRSSCHSTRFAPTAPPMGCSRCSRGRKATSPMEATGNGRWSAPTGTCEHEESSSPVPDATLTLRPTSFSRGLRRPTPARRSPQKRRTGTRPCRGQNDTRGDPDGSAARGGYIAFGECRDASMVQAQVKGPVRPRVRTSAKPRTSAKTSYKNKREDKPEG